MRITSMTVFMLSLTAYFTYGAFYVYGAVQDRLPFQLLALIIVTSFYFYMDSKKPKQIMKKDIKDYLHLYGLGCEVITPDGKGSILCLFPNVVEVSINTIGYKQVMTGRKGSSEMHWKYNYELIKPILRRLSDMPIKDKEFYGNRATFDAMEFKWLLEQGFDLFGLIEDGLAIDAATLK